jgi:plastocyanin
MKPRRRTWLAAAAAAWALAAPGQAAAQAVAPAGDEVVVEIRDYKFHPQKLLIKPGTTVRWINAEKRTTHTVRFSGPGGTESERLFPGEAWTHRFDKPGYVAYTCGPHPEMTGEIDVRP